jgi:glucokinase-like ROK family protein
LKDERISVIILEVKARFCAIINRRLYLSMAPKVTSSQRNHSPLRLKPHQKIVVDAIRQQGALSRTDLARKMEVSRAKITLLISKLIDDGVLVEIGDGDSLSGRRPRMLSFSASLGYVIGVYVGATSLDIAVADFNGEILVKHSEIADVRQGPNVVLARITKLALELVAEQGLSPDQVYGIGIGVPGPVEFQSGLLVSPPIMPGWDAFPIRAYMHEIFPLATVMVDNDVNIMALGELRNGIGVKDFIYVKIGTGIGAGIVCNGHIYRGDTGCAGDIGHISADIHGPTCHCGNVGCLEAMAAGPAIAQRAVVATQEGRSAFLATRLKEHGTLSAEDVGAGVIYGDRVCIEIIQDSGRLIGETLAALVNFYNPAMILLGGGVCNVGNQLLASIRQAVFRRSLPLSTRALRLDYSPLGNDAGIRGAVSLALEYVFSLTSERRKVG